jgi:hypothetical protein
VCARNSWCGAVGQSCYLEGYTQLRPVEDDSGSFKGSKVLLLQPTLLWRIYSLIFSCAGRRFAFGVVCLGSNMRIRIFPLEVQWQVKRIKLIFFVWKAQWQVVRALNLQAWPHSQDARTLHDETSAVIMFIENTQKTVNRKAHRLCNCNQPLHMTMATPAAAVARIRLTCIFSDEEAFGGGHKVAS